jgi:type II secretory pathway component PulF
MGLMLSGGMLLSDCSQTLLQIYQRSLFAAELEYFSRKVREGYMFGDALAECSFIPSMARQMLMVSEQSGALSEALLQLSQYYQQQVQQKLHRLAGMLEPCFVIILGLGILFMTGSLFLPMVQSYQYLLG